jgi:hypothetical protein
MLLVVKVVVVCDVFVQKGELGKALLRASFCSAVGRSLAGLKRG